VKDLVAKFAEVERRVRNLVEENGRLHERVRDLEQQLADAKNDSRDLAMTQERSAQVRTKLERILKKLEAIEPVGRDEDRNEGRKA
jgi:uncharacterized coiled-coil DUF342 family protein